MWRLVERYTGCVGYKRGTKSEGLSAESPVIDCSGWVGLLLTHAMQAENKVAERVVFRTDDVDALKAWSDRIIQEIETRTSFLLVGPAISASSLPRCATIGLKLGEPEWARNHPRSRDITHVVQLVRRPDDDAVFVSESFGGSTPPGVSLTPLTDWLGKWRPSLLAGEAWAVDPFRLAATNAD
jgi:hypothetical protein